LIIVDIVFDVKENYQIKKYAIGKYYPFRYNLTHGLHPVHPGDQNGKNYGEYISAPVSHFF